MEKIYELINKLIIDTQAKKEQYAKLLEITKNQSISIAAEDFDKLNEYIQEKAAIISIVDKLDSDFNDNFIEIKNILAVDDISKVDTSRYPKFKELKQLVVQITAIANEIQELDTTNRKKVNIAMEDVRNELITLNDNKKVTSAYHNVYAQTPDAYYFDKKK